MSGGTPLVDSNTVLYLLKGKNRFHVSGCMMLKTEGKLRRGEKVSRFRFNV